VVKLGIKYLEDEEIIKNAIQFLNEFNKDKTIPVPIEEIIDLHFNIDIIPLPGIKQLCDVDGFSAPDFSAIYVDLFVYENRYYRYRYTLAHEMGHFVFHKEKLSIVKLDQNDVIGSWIQFNNDLDPGDHSRMEYHGYTFGGLIMVPPDALKEKFIKHIDQIMPMVDEAKGSGISKSNYAKYIVDRMAVTLSPVFDASVDVLTRRINFDSLYDLIP